MEENIKNVEMDLGEFRGNLKSRNRLGILRDQIIDFQHILSDIEGIQGWTINSNFLLHHQHWQTSAPGPALGILRSIHSPLHTAAHSIFHLFPDQIQLEHLSHFIDRNMQSLCHMTIHSSPIIWLIQNLQRPKSGHKAHQSNGLIHLRGNQAGGGHQSKEETYHEVFGCRDHLHMWVQQLMGINSLGQSSLTDQQYPSRIVNVVQLVLCSQTPTTADLWLHTRSVEKKLWIQCLQLVTRAKHFNANLNLFLTVTLGH